MQQNVMNNEYPGIQSANAIVNGITKHPHGLIGSTCFKVKYGFDPIHVQGPDIHIVQDQSWIIPIGEFIVQSVAVDKGDHENNKKGGCQIKTKNDTIE